ncbi:MAG: DUF3343 domain-containing protein [Oscillospiraceae bacterium]|nr:DUF3343 domain-containing protein [Oscillospiraceae bacterium]MBR4691697.1 DUF3343 domain-containing protein [Oscillospiraceae bacterium]
MRNAYLELRSLTDAERAAELLHARRIPARAERLPAPRGCAFGVRVPAGSLETARRLLQAAGLTVLARMDRGGGPAGP